MAQTPEDKVSRTGFSGLESMVSDVSSRLESAERIVAGERSEAMARTQTIHPASQGIPSETASSKTRRLDPKSKRVAVALLVVGGVVVTTVWVSESEKAKSRPEVWTTVDAIKPSTAPSVPDIAPKAPLQTVPAKAAIVKPAKSEPKPAVPAPVLPVGELPPIGDSLVLTRAQIRYCVIEKIRMDAIQPIVNTKMESEVVKFNARVGDYNRRCGQFRYRQGMLESVKSEIGPLTQELAREARASWKKPSRLPGSTRGS